jgi:hypothetical protein
MGNQLGAREPSYNAWHYRGRKGNSGTHVSTPHTRLHGRAIKLRHGPIYILYYEMCDGEVSFVNSAGTNYRQKQLVIVALCRSQLPRDLRLGSAVARFLVSRLDSPLAHVLPISIMPYAIPSVERAQMPSIGGRGRVELGWGVYLSLPSCLSVRKTHSPFGPARRSI